VYALDAKTGIRLWSYPTGYIIFSSPAVANGVLYIGSHDHKVYALDAKTGVRLWSYPTGSNIFSSPAVANGVLYIGSANDNMYAFHLPGTQP
jgi:outer membrane protein assembly factor BamB